MKYLILLPVLFLTACDEDYLGQDFGVGSNVVTKEVVVLGRTWTVTRNTKTPNQYSAMRDNNNLNPFGKPVARRTPQAVRAFELATGCRVIPSTLYQNTSAEYFTEVACK